MELEKCGNIIRFWIIKSIEGEVNPPVFVKLLTKQYNIFLSSDFKFMFSGNLIIISVVCLMKTGL